MSRFEYLSVLISIVIALGISEVTVAWGRLIQNRKTVRFSLLHAFWSTFILVLMIQFWWAFWNFRTIDDWSFFGLMGIVLAAIALVVCALLLTPGRSHSANADLEHLYYEHARPFFAFGAYLLLQLSVNDSLIIRMPVLHTENLIRYVGAAIALLLACWPNKRLHTTLPVVCTALLVLFMLNSVIF